MTIEDLKKLTIDIDGKTVKETLFDKDTCKIEFSDGLVLLIYPSGASGYLESLVYKLKKDKY